MCASTVTLINRYFCLVKLTSHRDQHYRLARNIRKTMRHLGGSVGEASNFRSGHDLTVYGFKSHIRLCADSLEPGACFRFCVLPLSAPPLLALCLSLSQKINKHLKKLTEGRLGGSVGEASNFGSGRDLTFCGFEPRTGLCADSSEPGDVLRICVSLSLSAPPLLALCLPLSQK